MRKETEEAVLTEMPRLLSPISETTEVDENRTENSTEKTDVLAGASVAQGDEDKEKENIDEKIAREVGEFLQVARRKEEKKRYRTKSDSSDNESEKSKKGEKQSKFS